MENNIFKNFNEKSITAPNNSNISILEDLDVNIEVILGSTTTKIKNILNLVPGSIMELDQEQAELARIRINGVDIALCEIVTIDDKFGIRIKEILK